MMVIIRVVLWTSADGEEHSATMTLLLEKQLLSDSVCVTSRGIIYNASVAGSVLYSNVLHTVGDVCKSAQQIQEITRKITLCSHS